MLLARAILFVAAIPVLALAQAPGAVAGRVLQRLTTTPVIGATVRAGGRQATTDTAGRFLLGSLPAGRTTLQIRRIGYRTSEQTITVAPNDTLLLDVQLEAEAQLLAPLRTDAPRADVESFTAKPNVATIAMSAPAMVGVPSVGEPDVIRIVQLLPGVVARNDYSTGLNVRGGSADQNLVLLDGIPIYNPFHMGGVFSTFVDASVGGIELMTGAFPARYDGRLSSVLDVHSADETRSGIHGNADLSVLAATARLAGSSDDGKGSWSIAARRTYADAVASTFTTDNFPYHFTDVHGHAAYALPGDWRASFTLYAGKDLLNLDLASLVGDSTVSTANQGTWKYDWGNRVAGGTIAKDFGRALSVEQHVSSSGFFTNLDLGDGASEQKSTIHDVRAAGSITGHTVAHDASLGYEIAATHVRYASSSAQTGTVDFDIIQDPTSYAAWLDDLWRLSSRWLLETGLRADRLTNGREWAALSPRLSIKYFATPTVALTAAAGRVTQPLHSLAGDDPFRFFDVWLASDQYIPVESAWHYVLGAERRVEGSSVRVEGYVKQYDRVLDANPSDDPSVRGDEFLDATGRTYGADVLARWESRHGLSGWLSYSYGVATRERDGVRWWPGSDRRHDLNVVAVWRLARYRVGARLGYASGTPYTPIVGQVVRRAYDPSGDTWGTGDPPLYLEPLGGAKNSARFPANQRLDLDVSREMTYRGMTIAPYVSVVNAYNAHNVFVYIYDYSTDRPTRQAYSQFPVLPSVGVRVAF